MILSSSMKDNSSKEVTLTGDWIFDGNEAEVTGVAGILPHASLGGAGKYLDKDFTFGLRLSSLPFKLYNSNTGSGGSSQNQCEVTCTPEGILTLTRYTATSVDLVALGFDLSSGLRLELHWVMEPGWYTVHVYVNGFRALTRDGSNTNWKMQHAAYSLDGRGTATNSLNKKVKVRDVYFKDGGPLRNWKVHDLKCVIDNAQGLNRTDELKAYINNDMRALLGFVGDKPLTGQFAQLAVHTTVKAANKYRFSKLPVVSIEGIRTPLVQSTQLLNGVTESSVFTDIDAADLQDFSVAVSVDERYEAKPNNTASYFVVNAVQGQDGIYTIIGPQGRFKAYVDMTTDGGYWILSNRWKTVPALTRWRDVAVKYEPLVSYTNDEVRFPVIPSGTLNVSDEILLKHPHPTWVSSFGNWVKFKSQPLNKVFDSTGFPAVRGRDNANITLFHSQAGWQQTQTTDGMFGLMTVWGNSGICGGASRVGGTVCPVMYPDPSTSHYDRSYDKELYLRGAAIFESGTQVSAQYLLKNNAYDSVSEVEAALHNATIAQALVTTEQDSYMTCPAFIPEGDFTLEVKFSMSAKQSGSIMENVGSKTVWSLSCADTLKFGADVGSRFELDTGVTLELNREYHVAVVSSAGYVSIFIDGVRVALAPMYGTMVVRQAHTVIAEGYAGRTWDVQFSYSSDYFEDFEVQPLAEYVVAEYDYDTTVEVAAQVEFLPEDTYEPFEYEPGVVVEPEPEEPEDPEPEDPEPEDPEPQPEEPVLDPTVTAQFDFSKGPSDSVSGTELTLSGNARIADGVLITEATGDVATFPIEYFGAGDFTIEANVTLVAKMHDWLVVCCQYDSSSGAPKSSWNFVVRASDMVLHFIVSEGPVLTGIKPLQYGREYHIVAERYNGVITLYVDGETFASVAYAAPLKVTDFPVSTRSGTGSLTTGDSSRRIRSIRIASSALYKGVFN